jgi:hypothetical protein
VTEGLNSKIHSIESNARGFRSFQNYRTRIFFFCGKLDLYPLSNPKSRISAAAKRSLIPHLPRPSQKRLLSKILP